MTDIFISYRRNDSQESVGRIYDRLISWISKERVIRDVDNIPYGSNFEKYIISALKEVKVILVVIGPTWLSSLSKDGKERLDTPNDYVRIEIETAIRCQIPIIPILVLNACMPQPEELPNSILQLSYLNGMHVRPDPDFHRDMDRAIAVLSNNFKVTNTIYTYSSHIDAFKEEDNFAQEWESPNDFSTHQFLLKKLATDINNSHIGDRAASQEAIAEVQFLVESASLRSSDEKDKRLDSPEHWPSIAGYTNENYVDDLGLIHATSGGIVKISASAVSVGASSCLLSLSSDLMKYHGANVITDVYGRNGREHIDILISESDHDFTVVLSDCFFLMDIDRNLPYRLINIVTSTRQRLYHKISRRVRRKVAVYASKYSTADMQGILKFGIPGHANLEIVPTSGALIQQASEFEAGDYVIAWDPLWHTFEANPQYERVAGSEYACHHALLCHQRWRAPIRSKARKAFMNAFAYKWNQQKLLILDYCHRLEKNEEYMKSFSQAYGKWWNNDQAYYKV